MTSIYQVVNYQFTTGLILNILFSGTLRTRARWRVFNFYNAFVWKLWMYVSVPSFKILLMQLEGLTLEEEWGHCLGESDRTCHVLVHSEAEWGLSFLLVHSHLIGNTLALKTRCHIVRYLELCFEPMLLRRVHISLSPVMECYLLLWPEYLHVPRPHPTVMLKL